MYLPMYLLPAQESCQQQCTILSLRPQTPNHQSLPTLGQAERKSTTKSMSASHLHVFVIVTCALRLLLIAPNMYISLITILIAQLHQLAQSRSNPCTKYPYILCHCQPRCQRLNRNLLAINLSSCGHALAFVVVLTRQ